jgi:hypothetical protein
MGQAAAVLYCTILYEGVAMKLFVVVLVLFGQMMPALAQAPRSGAVCIGEREERCPAPREAWFPCGTTEEAAARQFCTVHSSAGPQSLKFEVRRTVTAGGGRCGFALIQVTCR